MTLVEKLEMGESDSSNGCWEDNCEKNVGTNTRSRKKNLNMILKKNSSILVKILKNLYQQSTA